MNNLSDSGNRRILVIDDNESIHEDYRKILASDSASATALAESEAALFGDIPAVKQHFELDSAYQGQDGLEMATRARAEHRPYAMAFVDMRMPPGWDGVETIERLWQADPRLQIALCTAYSDYSWDEISARLGFDDRLLILKKPFDNIEIRQMASALTAKWQMTQEAALRMLDLEQTVEKTTLDLQKMSHMAMYDALTALPSGILLQDLLTKMIASSQRHRKNLAVVFVGLDRFKRINASLGNQMGDALLKSVANRLVSTVRKSDAIFRRSGDEFVLVMEDVEHPEQTVIITEKLLSALRKPYSIEGNDLSIAASLGVSIYPMDGEDAETLIMKARTAMQNAKLEGGDTCLYFKMEMNHRARERQSMEGNLRRAIEQNEFILHYQPKIDIYSGVITGAEALIRWRHPELGFVSPAQFIPVAEDCGLIVPISQWVMREACRQARTWHDAGLPPMSVAVNVSALDFRSKSFLGDVRAALEQSGLHPDCLELELTEGALIQDVESTTSVLRGLKESGVSLAIDDFGTGYSSLSYLRRFPVDALKIDQSFVRDINTDEDDANIVKAIIAMGKSLRLKLIAEGVETRNQLTFLQENFCDEAQGYYFSRPVEAKEFAKLLASGIPGVIQALETSA